MISIPLKRKLTYEQEGWIEKNISVRAFYLHNAQGGNGWIARYEWRDKNGREWTLTFDNDKQATLFALRWGHEI